MGIAKWAGRGLGLLLVGYLAVCGYLFFRQRQVIYYPRRVLHRNPGTVDYQIPYEAVTFGEAGQRLTGWWLPEPRSSEVLDILPGEPSRVLRRPKVLLYFCGVGPNMGAPNYSSRVKALRQLGFSVFIFDYRGYGGSDGPFPNESRVYEDAAAAWRYLTEVRGVEAQDIVLYGESMGGAVAIEMAKRQPQAYGLIVQSSFTSMASVIKRQGDWYSYFPIDVLLTEK
jgi:uncharacterized protein